MVHIHDAVRIDFTDERDRLADRCVIIPINYDPGGTCNCRHMYRQIRRPTRRHEADQSIHDALFGNHFASWSEGGVFALGHIRDLRGPPDRLRRECIPQRRVRMNKAGAWQLHTHDFHQHLIGVGRSVKGTRPRRVIARSFDSQQIRAGRLTRCKGLANASFFGIGQAGWHRTGRRKNLR